MRPGPAKELGTARASWEELHELVERDGSIGDRLVLLEEIPREELAGALGRWEELLVLRHPAVWDRLLARADRIPGVVAPAALQREHTIFPSSVGQLRWLFDLTGREGHGGNRQALGQSWKLLVEAVSRHLADERGYLEGIGTEERGRTGSDEGRGGADRAAPPSTYGQRS